jgi:hypothetical protein
MARSRSYGALAEFVAPHRARLREGYRSSPPQLEAAQERSAEAADGRRTVAGEVAVEAPAGGESPELSEHGDPVARRM